MSSPFITEYTAALYISCGRCGAQPFNRCRDPKYKPCRPHAIRVREAKDQVVVAVPPAVQEK
jgi:hypothetical protein